MRRAFGWLLPGHAANGPFASISAVATPGWLYQAADAVAGTAAAAVTDARGFATRAGSSSAAATPASLPSTSGCPGDSVLELGAAGSSPLLTTSMPHSSPALTSAAAAAAEDAAATTSTAAAAAASATAQHLGTSADSLLGTTAASAVASSSTPFMLDACTAAEPSIFMVLVQNVAGTYDFVHDTTGLPWAASIPLTTLALRLALLPLSMRQARIIRANFNIYKEALALTEQQEQEQREEKERQDKEQQLQNASSSLLQENQHQQQQQQGQPSSSSQPLQPTQPHHHQPVEHHTATAPASTSSAPTTATEPSSSTSGSGSGSPEDLPSAVLARLLRSQAVLANYDMLRRKCDAPHPVWMVVNPLVQIPVFVTVSATLGMMCRAHWHGLSSEGALWFPDLTLPALVLDTWEMPLGPAGMALPLLVYAMTMTSLRLGFGASGVAAQRAAAVTGGPAAAAGGPVPDTPLSAFLRSLPPLLYAMTTLNLYFKVQMAHGVLVHWLGSAGFTLALQMALRNPALRALLKINRPAGGTLGPASSLGPSSYVSDPAAPAEDASSSATSSSATSSSSPSSSSDASSTSSSAAAPAPPAAAPSAGLPRDLVARVAETTDPNVLVIMGAQLSARHHYPGALHCLRKAVLLKPSHVRAHYSMGQVYSLTDQWPDAELSYRAAAELSPEGPERGQALYCVATALHAQGKLEEAAEAYAEADVHWRGQTVIAYGRANALAAAGRRTEALAAVADAEARDEAMAGRPFKQALGRLRERLVKAKGGEGSDGGKEGEGKDGK